MLYRDILAKRCRRASVAVWAYCLMPNHVHLIVVPLTADGLARAIGETHRQHTGFINARAHAAGRDDGLVMVAPLLERVGNGADLIGIEPEPATLARLRAGESTGRPLGAQDFLEKIGRRLGRALRPRKPDPKPRTVAPGLLLEMEIRGMSKVSP